MSNFAKPIDTLLKTPTHVQKDMENLVDYMDFAQELRDDIAGIYNHPSLWAAIDRLLDFTEKHATAYERLKASGYTFDDAIVFKAYLKEQTQKEGNVA